MTWHTMEGKRPKFVGGVKDKWGGQNDDDLNDVDGNREKLTGKFQERIDWVRDRADREIDAHFRDKL